jgi:hypothetical protein
MSYFYSKKYEIKLESEKDPYPSRVIYIGLSKRLNDYYVPMV